MNNGMLAIFAPKSPFCPSLSVEIPPGGEFPLPVLAFLRVLGVKPFDFVLCPQNRNTEDTVKTEGAEETSARKTARPPDPIEVDSNFAKRLARFPISPTREGLWQSWSQEAPDTSAA